jgi:hypothetical protein
MEGDVGLKNASMTSNIIFQSDFDHVDFVVAARYENLTYWTAPSEACWSVRPTTFTIAITELMGVSFPSSDTIW